MNLRRLEVACPAKLNFLLYVTGKRGDGYHELLSLAAPVAYGDKLEGVLKQDSVEDVLTCNDAKLPTGDDNLVLKAVAAFRRRATLSLSIHLHLTKRVPVGAGLGGGSSDAASTLLILNALAPRPLDQKTLREAAAEVGSDVPLFLGEGPVIMRGRGEVIDPVPRKVHEYMAGRRFFIFKPEFSVDTAWAYGQLAEAGAYDTPETARKRIRTFLDDPYSGLEPCYNIFESVVFHKYRVYKALADALEREGFPRFYLSGSGSSCFMPSPEAGYGQRLRALFREYLGESAFVIETQVV